MTKYASKELIERAVELNGMTISNEIDHDEWKDARDDLIKDLSKATPLPYLVPRDEIDRQWLRAIFALIERHGLDPALEIHTVTSHVLQERKK